MNIEKESYEKPVLVKHTQLREVTLSSVGSGSGNGKGNNGKGKGHN